jgi:hypothetical protein
LRLARKAVVLVEPIYELASEQAKTRMREHRYIQGLKAAAERLNASIVEYGLLEVCGNPLNPSGILLLLKYPPRPNSTHREVRWQCPLTGTILVDQGDVFFAFDVGIAYPVMRGIPLLRGQHAVVASKLSTTNAPRTNEV